MATDVQSRSDENVSSLVAGIVEDAQELIQQQFTLLKVELESDFRKTQEAMLALVLGAGIALIGSIVLAFAVVQVFVWAFPAVAAWVWYALVGAALTGVGSFLTWQARERFRSFNPLPDKTAEGLQENLEWKTK